MATNLYRYYQLPENKNLQDLAYIVMAFFENYDGADLEMKTQNDTYLITCKTRFFLNDTDAFRTKMMGLDINISVELYQEGDHVKVTYQQDINNLLQVIKGLVIANPVKGLFLIKGAIDRHNIPSKLHETIKAYLNS